MYFCSISLFKNSFHVFIYTNINSERNFYLNFDKNVAIRNVNKFENGKN